MEKIKLCIISNKNPVYSETFIRDHIKKIPAQITFLYGKTIPIYNANNIPITSYIFSKKIPKQWLEIALKIKSLREIAIRKVLKKERIQVILAEYGKIGVALQTVCHQLNIPLIVHFHGYDAYDKKVLNQVGQNYPALFKQAAATIAVSKDMEQQLLKLGAVPEKLYYNPYGVDINLFKQTQPHHNPPNFLAVGRFVDKKAPYSNPKSFVKNKLLSIKRVFVICFE